MDDKMIIDLYWKRDQSAIVETQNKYGKYCFSISYNILKNSEDAEECINDTYLRVWNSIPPQRPNIFSAFIGKITRTISLDRWRKNHAQKRGNDEIMLSFDELEECISQNNSANLLDEENKERLEKAISAFLKMQSKTDRQVFVHRYWHFKSINEICQTYGFSKSKTKMILKRMRDKLFDYLKEEGIYQ